MLPKNKRGFGTTVEKLEKYFLTFLRHKHPTHDPISRSDFELSLKKFRIYDKQWDKGGHPAMAGRTRSLFARPTHLKGYPEWDKYLEGKEIPIKKANWYKPIVQKSSKQEFFVDIEVDFKEGKAMGWILKHNQDRESFKELLLQKYEGDELEKEEMIETKEEG